VTDTETTQSREQGPRRRSGALILGAAALVAAAGLLGYGAYAAFTDTETSSVSIDAGQLDITLATTPITVTDIAPGDVLYRQVAVQVPGATNDGDLIAALEVSATNVVSTPGDPADTGNPAEGDVAGVGLDAGTDPLQLVVANCDAGVLYGRLLPRSIGGPVLRSIDRAGLSFSGFVLLLALRGSTPDLGHHTVLFPADYDDEFDSVYGIGRRPARPTPDPAVYVCSPDDPLMRPEGHEAWFVLVAPAGTPQPIIDKLSAEVDRILKKPDVAERFAKLGATPVGGTPKQLGDFIAAETRKWQQVVKVSGAKVD